jgi:Family of unknown function (DUF5999)
MRLPCLKFTHDSPHDRPTAHLGAVWRACGARHGHCDRAGIMSGDEQVKFPPLHGRGRISPLRGPLVSRWRLLVMPAAFRHSAVRTAEHQRERCPVLAEFDVQVCRWLTPFCCTAACGSPIPWGSGAPPDIPGLASAGAPPTRCVPGPLTADRQLAGAPGMTVVHVPAWPRGKSRNSATLIKKPRGTAMIAIAYARRKGLARAAHAFRVPALRGAGARITWLGSSTWAAHPGRDYVLSASALLAAGGRAGLRGRPCRGRPSGTGVVVFEDTGDLLPDGRIIAPHRAAA